MPSIAFRRDGRQFGALAQRRRGTRPGAMRSPLSAAVIAYSIGPVAHSRPSASFFTAASTSSSRSVRPTAIQPARQPGARYAFDSEENVITGASGLCCGDRRHRTVEGEIGVDLVGEEREVVRLRRCRPARAAPRADRPRPVGLFGSMATSARVAGVIRLRM